MIRFALLACAAFVAVPAAAETVTIDFEPGTFSLLQDEGLFRTYGVANGFEIITTGFINNGFLRNEVTLSGQAAFIFNKVPVGFMVPSFDLRSTEDVRLIGTNIVFNTGGVFQTFGPFAGELNLNSRAPFDLDNIVVEIAAVPEPATWVMMIAGFGLVGSAARRGSVRLAAHSG